MKNTVVYSLAAITAVSLTAFASRNAISSGQGTSLVRLQTATPGTSQTGHANVNGTIRAGQFVGGGAGLTALNAGQITSGTVPSNRLPVPMVLNGAGTLVIDAETTSATLGAAAIKGEASDNGSIVFGVWGVTDSTFGRGVYGWNQAISGSAAYGVYGKSDSTVGSGVFGYSEDGMGVQGHAAATSGVNYGVYGVTDSTSGRGVRGYASTTSGINYGVAGQTLSPDGFGSYGLGINVGVLARATGSTGTPMGLRGEANATDNNGYGVYGETSAPNGAGVMGVNNATTEGLGAGLYGEGGTGVYGVGIGTGVRGTSFYNYGGYFFGNDGAQGIGARGNVGAIGLYGVTQNSEGYGVLGTYSDVGGPTGSPAYGVYGLVDRSGDRATMGDSDITSGSAYGLFGDTDGGVGFAVYASGDHGGSGTKSFRIDHPLDPENKYLLHYCTEGPEPLLEYSGTVRTGTDGYVWVALPEYFAEINRDLRYQLTVVDEAGEFTMALVSKKVKNNRFQIRTSRPNVEVCWEVKGVRNDRYVRHYGAPVSVDKPDNERGLFEHPELFGLGREKSFPHDQVRGYKKNRLKENQAPTR